MSRHGHRPSMQISRRHELWLYVAAALLFISGLGWLMVHYLRAPGGLSDVPGPSEPWWLRLHGAALIGFLIIFGSLVPGHVFHGWRYRVNHRSGIFMLTLVTVLTLTGYGLYYAGDETTRPWISTVHWTTGLVAAAALGAHVLLGKRARVRLRAELR